MEPTRSHSQEAPIECEGLLDTYSKEMQLSSLPVVVSDVFPAYRPKHRLPKPVPRTIFPPLTKLQRISTSPYSLAWSQRTLERHFQVFIKSQRQVCRIKANSLDPQYRRVN